MLLCSIALKNAGCDAVKFQTYISEKRVPKNQFPELYDIIKSCELSLSDFEKIKLYCDELGVEFISTPFDEESIDFLNSILFVRKYSQIISEKQNCLLSTPHPKWSFLLTSGKKCCYFK